MDLTGVIQSQYKRIDAYRPVLIFIYIYVAIDILFKIGILITSAYPPIIAFIFTPQLESSMPLFYDLTLNITKIISLITPFIFTFFVLDKALYLFMLFQKYEQKFVKKLIEKYFTWYYKKYKKDPKMPKQLGFIQKLASIQLWFLKKKVWQQWALILGFFIINNPYLLFVGDAV